ncbi:hypothetical protein K8T06_10080 [bacterium]|nr:hypothetical protein [bacterium]
MRFCKKCYGWLKGEPVFCPDCGSKTTKPPNRPRDEDVQGPFDKDDKQ